MHKKILFVSNYPLTEPVIRNRLFPFLSEFANESYAVSLVCPKSNFDKEKIPASTNLIEADISVSKPGSFIKRAMKEFEEARFLLKLARKKEVDVVVVTMPSMFLGFLAPVYLRKKEVLLDVRDLSWEYLSENSLLSRLAKKIFRRFFQRSIGFFKAISVTNNTELKYIKKIKPNEKIIELVTNGISREQFNKLRKLPVKNDDRFTVAYIGNLGLAQQLDTLLIAAQQLPHFQFYIVGGGNDEIRLKALLDSMNLTNVVMTGRVSWEKVINYYAQSNVLYAQLSPEFSGAMPSKLYEYLATGKWVVYGGIGQAPEILEPFEGCNIIPPCSSEALVNLLAELEKNMPKDYISIANIEKIEKEYIRENSVRSYIDKLRDNGIL